MRRIIAASALIPLLLLLKCPFAQEASKDKESVLRGLINDLYKNPWPGPEIRGISPTIREFSFTGPMLKILEIGPPAQDALLDKLSDPQIKDQVIILLGGVGDEQAVGPIINAMVGADEIKTAPNAKRINLSANLALTNITVADIIWHHGGGRMIIRCPENPKECWQRGWRENEAKFSVKGITESRRYSNYPNYGIYRQQ